MKITPRQYAQALYDALHAPGAQARTIVPAFVQTLKKNGNMSLAPQIIRHFTAIADAQDGTVRATVTMVREPSAQQDKAIRAFLAAKYRADRAEVTYVTDARVRGGFVVRVGDEEYDASVRRRMQILAQHLVRTNR